MVHTVLYIDPGSGSYLVQVIVAAVLGVVVFFRNIKTHIKTFFFRPKKKDGSANPENTHDSNK